MDPQGPVAAALTDTWTRELCRKMLGTADPATITRRAGQLCLQALGEPMAEVFHCELSAGVVLGLVAGDQRYLLKWLPPGTDLNGWQARSRCQAWLAGEGLPVPAVMSEPARDGEACFRFEAFLDAGRRADGHDREDIRLMAGALARLLSLCEQYPAAETIPVDVLPPSDYHPWPVPHSPMFNFEATREGATWIDEAGSEAAAILAQDTSARIIGHMDWGAKHTRILDGQVSALYDWDALGRAPEATVVGAAMRNFAASWYLPGANEPTLDEMRWFLGCYLAARPVSLDPLQVAASIRFGAAYGARCEHAGDPAGDDRTALRDFLRLMQAVDLPGLITEASSINQTETHP